MAVTVKTKREIELMREANHRLEKVFDALGSMIRPGISTWDIDQAARELISEQGGIPNFLNYDGFPGAICTSVNEEVVHGIPKKERILREGDIISLDCGLILNGYHSDAARTYPVGKIAEPEQRLIEVTRAAFFEGIRYATAGRHLHEIGNAIGDSNFRMKSRGLRLVAGMTLAIEPMINEGTWEVDWMDDDWTVVTKDGRPSAHYENTILITDGEPEILSKTHD